MKKIPLTKGKFALIDDDDFDIVNKGKWSVLFNGFNWYAYRRVGKNSDMLYLHRYIMGVTDGDIFVDHINGDGLDCRKSNMRLCNHSQNMANRGKQKNNKSGYKGVRKTVYGTYEANIQCNNKYCYIGVFKTPEDAAKAYDRAAKELFGDFAYQNFK